MYVLPVDRDLGRRRVLHAIRRSSIRSVPFELFVAMVPLDRSWLRHKRPLRGCASVEGIPIYGHFYKPFRQAQRKQ